MGNLRCQPHLVAPELGAGSSHWPVKLALGYKPPLDPDPVALMNPFWSQITRELSP